MLIRKATHEEYDDIHEILVQAATRIKAKKSEQWKHILEGNEKNSLIHQLRQDTVVVGVVEDEIVAVCYLYQNQEEWDAKLWSELPELEQTFYLHRLALADKATGQGLAQVFLSSLFPFLEKEYKAQIVRLDCMAEKPMLNRLYQASGFKLVGKALNVPVENFFADFNLYEQRVGDKRE